MRSVRQLFDEVYNSHDRYWWKYPHVYSSDPEVHAASLLTQATLRVVHSRPPGRALDLGSGEGADAIRLALMGWTVDAVELSSVGAEKIRRFAKQAATSVKVYNADASKFVLNDGPYDLIICNGLLHYIEDKATLCRNMQSMTAAGGTNVISTWSSFTAVPRCHQIVPIYPEPEDGELVRVYRSWRKSLLYFERSKQEMAHDDFEPHVHSFIKMVAHKS